MKRLGNHGKRGGADQKREAMTPEEQLEARVAILEAQQNQPHLAKKPVVAESISAAQKVSDLLTWLQNYTQTKDPHWREAKAKSPYRPFPDKPYFRPIIEVLQREPVVFCAKSRDLMMSWLFVGFFTHDCMTTPGVEVLFQSQTEDKAAELVEYAKILYRRQDEDIKDLYPLATPLEKQSRLELNFRDGNRIVGIPHGADKVRSYHPTALFIDEAAFIDDAGHSYEEAIAACKKIAVLSSANAGWFDGVVVSAE
jgi:hypothetical protein